MFDGFTLEHLDVDGVRLRVRHGGQGPAVVLLHGHPRTHTTWHRVAPALAETFTVVCPDLRGYGGSAKPASAPDHVPYSKRTMARDMVGLMEQLGHDRFAVVGHDRGAYVAQRLALDHPGRVTHLGILDSVPIGEALARADARFATSWWHWFFLGQTVRPAETVITPDAERWYAPQADPALMGAENHADLMAAVRDPATVHAMCEDYRAGLGVDREADDADRARGVRLTCPLMMLWATGDDMGTLYGDPLEIWRDWADDVHGGPVESGHHLAEEAPEAVVDAVRGLLRRPVG